MRSVPKTTLRLLDPGDCFTLERDDPKTSVYMIVNRNNPLILKLDDSVTLAVNLNTGNFRILKNQTVVYPYPGFEPVDINMSIEEGM